MKVEITTGFLIQLRELIRKNFNKTEAETDCWLKYIIQKRYLDRFFTGIVDEYDMKESLGPLVLNIEELCHNEVNGNWPDFLWIGLIVVCPVLIMFLCYLIIKKCLN